MLGTVKRIFLTRGFAFAKGDDQLDYFVHVDDMKSGQSWEDIRSEMRLEFEPKPVEKGLRAKGWVMR